MAHSRLALVEVDQGQQLATTYPLFVLVVSLSECSPCAILERVVTLLAADEQLSSWEFAYCCVERSNKRELGKALKLGIRSFPTVRVFRNGSILHSFSEPDRSWDTARIQRFLTERLLAASPLNGASLSRDVRPYAWSLQ